MAKLYCLESGLSDELRKFSKLDQWFDNNETFVIMSTSFDGLNIVTFMTVGAYIRKSYIPDTYRVRHVKYDNDTFAVVATNINSADNGYVRLETEDGAINLWCCGEVMTRDYHNNEETTNKIDSACELDKCELDNGTDVHADDDYALRWASENGHLEVVKLLLDNGADVHTYDDIALCGASRNGHLEVVKLLLDNGADVHADNDVALRWASENGHLEVVKLLLDNGASIYACNDYALRWASENGHLEVVKLLLDNGANVHACDDIILHRVSRNGHLDVVKLLKKYCKNGN